MVREQGGITGAIFISPQAPGSLGLVVNIYHLVGGLHLQNNSGNLHQILLFRASLVAQRLKRLPAMRETWVWSLGREDPLEKELATHSSILAWRNPWTEEPGRLQSMGSQESDMTERLHFHFQTGTKADNVGEVCRPPVAPTRRPQRVLLCYRVWTILQSTYQILVIVRTSTFSRKSGDLTF